MADVPPPSGDLGRANYATIWDAVAHAVPDRVAVQADGESITYADFQESAARLAATFVAHGLGPGSTVAIFMYNRPEYLTTLYAAYKIGAIPVNLNFRYQGAELAELLETSRPAALVHPRSLSAAVVDAGTRVPLPGLVLVVPDDAPPDVPASPGTPFAAALAADPLPPRELDPDHRIFMFTGGTTGRPKAVVWTHGNLFDSQLFSVYGSLPVDPPTSLDDVTRLAARDDLPPTVCLPLPPMMHATALFNVMNAIVLGGTVVFLSAARFDPRAAVRAIAEHRVTRLVVAGNAVVGPLVQVLDTDPDADVSSLTTVLSSGMVWSDDLKRRLAAHAPHATLVDILGSSEGGPFAYGVVRGPDDFPCRPRLAPGAVVLAPDLTPVEEVGGTGMLAYRGAMPLGYHEDPVRTAQTYPVIDGVRHVMPGDWVRVLGDGYVELLGRGSGVVNTGGEKVFPGEVEKVLLALPGVADAVVLGLPDPRWGEVVTAVVVPEPGEPLAPAQVQDEVGRRLAGYKKPRRLYVIDELQRSPSGKVDMHRLRQRLAEGRPALVDTALVDPSTLEGAPAEPVPADPVPTGAAPGDPVPGDPVPADPVPAPHPAPHPAESAR
ncbi:AMP-dependent synthetase and ligase [Cellulomonas flavigena DSM 20109]|uniref:AMP-dependent synthetase and ligase n=1 Tax=Cellulomonas flavigena (strain ATCC 482 / DSM 20109 / BCRC 11376 / JCM 18109 / NBRC 3775 / NCIMB 8073 / NRS 134) TaxID=446466 RepID=D5UH06_CELFN|nr:AMP-binding protein [Cellulomonas flavigena]ADG73209.1 AMP-dependent synthetase and ligase [Cellulomonas flavigena DSM 20109]